jgi:hypothetical protein
MSWDRSPRMTVTTRRKRERIAARLTRERTIRLRANWNILVLHGIAPSSTF